MKLILAEPFKTLWAGRDAFAEVEKLEGQVFRELAARRTLRTVVEGQPYFVKIHRGIGWGEILKNLVTAKLPVLGAGQEWVAIQRLQALGVPTMTAVAFGEKGSNPADQHSFIITQELTPIISLEDLTLDLARTVGAMHRGGVNHRDCYLCHFLLHTDRPISVDNLKLSVIDLHRAQVRATIPVRWRNKDLAGLYYSALEIGLTQRDKLRFLKAYFQQPLRQILAEQTALLSALERMAAKLYARKQRYGDAI